MSQGLLVTLISLFLYLSGSLGGGLSTDNPQAPAPNPVPGTSWQSPSSTSSRQMAMVVETANLRTGPGTTYPSLGTLPKGAMVFLQTSRNGWTKVSLPDGRTGWIRNWLISTKAGANLTRSNPKLAPVEVIGYYTMDHAKDVESYQSLQRYSSQLTGISPFFFKVDSLGNVSGQNHAATVALAKSRGLKALALIHNSNGSGFSGGVAHNLLVYPTRRARAITNILNILRAYGYDGVNIDFENLYPMDRPHFSAFIRELAMALKPKGYLVTVSVPAKTREDFSSRWSGAFDYRAIGQYADLVMLMTYDEHFRYGPPGPVASYGWVDSVVRFAQSQIPREKILLGIATYGYDWPLRGGNARSLSYRQIQDLLRRYSKKPQWSWEARVPFFTYLRNGVRRIVWYESSASLSHKVQLVKKYGLRGVAMWKLGYEDPQIWQVLSQLRS